MNWAQIVQQKMGEEIRMHQEGNPKTLELFLAFYIYVYCQDLSQHAPVTTTPLILTPIPSPLTSPEKLGEL